MTNSTHLTRMLDDTGLLMMSSTDCTVSSLVVKGGRELHLGSDLQRRPRDSAINSSTDAKSSAK